MQPNHLRVCRRQKIAETEPDVATLPGLCRGQAALFQFLVQRGQPGAAVPKDMMPLRQPGKIILGIFELVLVGAIQPDDDVVKLAHSAQFIADIFKGRTLQPREQTG